MYNANIVDILQMTKRKGKKNRFFFKKVPFGEKYIK